MKAKHRKFWIVMHENNHVWVESFAFHRNRAIEKFLTAWGKDDPTWRKARREGFRVVAVNLRLARA